MSYNPIKLKKHMASAEFSVMPQHIVYYFHNEAKTGTIITFMNGKSIVVGDNPEEVTNKIKIAMV